MKNSAYVLAILLIFSGCSASRHWVINHGQHPHHIEKKISSTVAFDMLIYSPRISDAESNRWPLIIFLHGSGERGSDPKKLMVHSLPKMLMSDDEFPFIVVSPQCPDGKRWNAEELNVMLNEVVRELPVDTTRIYLTGLSSGGFGVWKFAIAYPERFAAIAPVCGWGHLEDVVKLKSMPVWVFHGAKDDVVPPSESEKMVEFLKKKGNTNVRFTLYPDANHNAWDQTYSNPELYQWFLQYSRRQ